MTKQHPKQLCKSIIEKHISEEHFQVTDYRQIRYCEMKGKWHMWKSANVIVQVYN